jgi:acyl phosphate:glycerol-3-phosphate acyltransferase
MPFPFLSTTDLAVIGMAYLLGCFSTGYYITRLRTGQDIRQVGSGSTGGTNVGRLLGKRGFAVTMAGDLLKGAAAIGIARYMALRPWVTALVVLAVVAGHIVPIQLGFRGGKGLATALGAMLVLDYRLALVIVSLTGLAGALSRQFVLSLVVVIAATPALAAIVGHTPLEAASLVPVALLIMAAHRTNIRTALQGIRSQPRTGK